jgi:hypothetical protein
MAWYYVQWSYECGLNTTTKGCGYVEYWYYLYTTCDEGGTSEGGGDGGYQSNTPNADQVYNSSSTLEPSQKLALESAIVGFKNRAQMYASIWQSLVSYGVSIKFKIGYVPDQAPASISPDGKTITFKDESSICTEYLQEELIHKYQSIYYGSVFVQTIRNYEFEAKVLEDVTHFEIGYPGGDFGTCCFQSQADRIEYQDWIGRLARGERMNNGTFNSLCQRWYYPRPDSPTYCNPNFVPHVYNSCKAGDFIEGGGTIY